MTSSNQETQELDLTGFNLGQKKEIKEYYSKVYSDAVEELSKFGIKLSLDMQGFEKNTRDKDERKNVGNVGLGRHIPTIVSEIKDWAEKTPDYKEALIEHLSEIVFTAHCYDEKKDRTKIEINEKTLVLSINCYYINYGLDWRDNITKYLEENLGKSEFEKAVNKELKTDIKKDTKMQKKIAKTAAKKLKGFMKDDKEEDDENNEDNGGDDDAESNGKDAKASLNIKQHKKGVCCLFDYFKNICS